MKSRSELTKSTTMIPTTYEMNANVNNSNNLVIPITVMLSAATSTATPSNIYLSNKDLSHITLINHTSPNKSSTISNAYYSGQINSNNEIIVIDDEDHVICNF